MSKLLDARTAGPWAHDPPGSGTVVSTVYRGRVIAQCERLEDADAIARSYEEWPAALERERIAIGERDDERTECQHLRSVIADIGRDHHRLANIAEQAIEQARVSQLTMGEACRSSNDLSALLECETGKVAELERMLTAWQKHRHSPSLLADWTRYQNQKEKP